MSLRTTTDTTDHAVRTATSAPSLLRRLLQVTASDTTFVLAGSAFAAVGAYVFQLLGARLLGPTAFAPVTVLWTIHVLLLAVALVPLERFVTRRLELTRGHSAELGSVLRAVVSLLGLCLIGVLVFVTPDAGHVLRRRRRLHPSGRPAHRRIRAMRPGTRLPRGAPPLPRLRDRDQRRVPAAPDRCGHRGPDRRGRPVAGHRDVRRTLATLALRPFYRSAEPAVPTPRPPRPLLRRRRPASSSAPW